jgi:sRNA-binding regulator protein Hfq
VRWATMRASYGVPVEDLRWRLDWPRKALSRALVECVRADAPITLYLWNGRQLSGTVKWWDLGAVGLETGGENPVVIQRHAVERWDPRAADDSEPAEDPAEEL